MSRRTGLPLEDRPVFFAAALGGGRNSSVTAIPLPGGRSRAFLDAFERTNDILNLKKMKTPTIPFSSTFARWSVSGAIALATASAALAQSRYMVTELPDPVGYSGSAPYQINDQGIVSGCSTKV